MCIAYGCFGPAVSAEFNVQTLSQLDEIQSQLQPGDEVVLSPGEYRDASVHLWVQGTTAAPIVFRAAQQGRVIFSGAVRLAISGTHLIIDGLVFRDGSLTKDSVITLRGPKRRAARHCTLKNIRIEAYNPPLIDTRYHWLSLYGSHHLVEQCRFFGQNHSGVTLCVWLDHEQAGHHVIQRNHFLDRAQEIKTVSKRFVSARAPIAISQHTAWCAKMFLSVVMVKLKLFPISRVIIPIRRMCSLTVLEH